MITGPDQKRTRRRAGWFGLAVLTSTLVLTACGSADEPNDAETAAAKESPDATASVDATPCPRGDELIARVRALQDGGSDAAIERFTRAMQAGAGERDDSAANDETGGQGCAGFETLSPAQTETYVDLIYNGPPEMAPALVFGQTEAARRAILDAYRNDPDAVTNNPGLAAALAMAQIGSGESYAAAYEDLAYAALNDGIPPRYVRGYLWHFGCGYEDAVWAARTKERADFLEGDAFPTSTSPEQAGESALVEDRMALLQRGQVPKLRAECPLSVQYASDRNGDTLTRLKLQARDWADELHTRFGDYADRLGISGSADEPSKEAPKEDAEDDAFSIDIEGFDMDALGARMRDNMQAFGELARQAGDFASARLQTCRQRLDQGFSAVVDCFKVEPPKAPAETAEPNKPDESAADASGADETTATEESPAENDAASAAS